MSETTWVRDRDGDLLPVIDQTARRCVCDGTGWAGEDCHGRAVVCLACKPHLEGRVPRQYRAPRRHR
jgi:hypothetical protein